MPREDIYFTGRLRPVDEPTPTPDAEADRHGFSQVSRVARADPRLSHRAFRVLACLEGYCFGDDRESWPCNKTIGLACGGIGPNAVRLALRELEKAGYLEVIPDITRMRGSRLKILYHLKQPETY